MNQIKQRILTGWTFTRAFYVLMGALIIAQFVAHQQWIGILVGSYFVSMGVLVYGCSRELFSDKPRHCWKTR